jgi:hypothetical protein
VFKKLTEPGEWVVAIAAPGRQRPVRPQPGKTKAFTA